MKTSDLMRWSKRKVKVRSQFYTRILLYDLKDNPSDRNGPSGVYFNPRNE